MRFRRLLHVSAVVVLAGGVTACGLRTPPSNAGPKPGEDPGVQWQLGELAKVSGCDCIVAPISIVGAGFEGFSSGKTASDTYNYLFINTRDQSSRKLLPKNDHAILQMERLTTNGFQGFSSDKENPVRWLIFHVVAADTNGDHRLTRDDRTLIAISKPDGSEYTEVLRDIDEIHGEIDIAPDRLLVVYSASGKYRIAEISLPDRKVTVTRDLPRLGP